MNIGPDEFCREYQPTNSALNATMSRLITILVKADTRHRATGVQDMMRL